MTRLPYLTRLAFGRSAFQPDIHNERQHEVITGAATRDGGEQVAGIQSSRTSKRSEVPENEASKADHAAQVRAKNEVLEAIGVTERKVRRQEEVSASLPSRKSKDREQLDKEISDNVQIVYEFGSTIGTWWLEGLRKRVLAGLTCDHRTFAQVLQGEWRTFRTYNLRGKLGYLTAGMELCLARDLLVDISTEIVDTRLMGICYPSTSHTSGPGVPRLSQGAALTLRTGARIAIEVALSPLTIMSLLQQLQLWRLGTDFELLQTMLPWSHASPLTWATGLGAGRLSNGTGTPISALRSFVCSPVVLSITFRILSDFIVNSVELSHFQDDDAVLGSVSRASSSQQSMLGRYLGRLSEAWATAHKTFVVHTRWCYNTVRQIAVDDRRHRVRRGVALDIVDTTELLQVLGATPAEAAMHPLHGLPQGFENQDVQQGTGKGSRISTSSTVCSRVLNTKLCSLMMKVVEAPFSYLLYQSLRRTWKHNRSSFPSPMFSEPGGRNVVVGRYLLCLASEAAIEVVLWTGACITDIIRLKTKARLVAEERHHD